MLVFDFAKWGFHVWNLTGSITIQTTDDASLGELGDVLVVKKENHTDDGSIFHPDHADDDSISHRDRNMGNLNNLPQAMSFIQNCSFGFDYVAKLYTVDICVPISQLLGMKQQLILMQKSPRWVSRW